LLPALVDPAHPGVTAMRAAHQQMLGKAPQTFYGQGTFDAGGPCAAGVPSVMYGVGGGVFPLGVDFVPISHAVTVAKVMVHTIVSLLS